ncbi:hypothetical protein U0355_09545 [Salimicrobium sp. PL1-032A]|uniref:hypothetical protein n=1 Tax=Salimicrobium sp. PL1-032A TaxID=3095364 RepID=UPI0032605E10
MILAGITITIDRWRKNKIKSVSAPLLIAVAISLLVKQNESLRLGKKDQERKVSNLERAIKLFDRGDTLATMHLHYLKERLEKAIVLKQKRN